VATFVVVVVFVQNLKTEQRKHRAEAPPNNLSLVRSVTPSLSRLFGLLLIILLFLFALLSTTTSTIINNNNNKSSVKVHPDKHPAHEGAATVAFQRISEVSCSRAMLFCEFSRSGCLVCRLITTTFPCQKNTDIYSSVTLLLRLLLLLTRPPLIKGLRRAQGLE
jgi:hypothetical protein